MCNILNMCYITNIMLPRNITLQYYLSSPLIIMCNILNVMCNTPSQYYPCNITMLHYLSSLCAIFLIFFLSCAILPLTIIIITLLLRFNFCQIVFADWMSCIFIMLLFISLFYSIAMQPMAQEFPSGLIKFYLILSYLQLMNVHIYILLLFIFTN